MLLYLDLNCFHRPFDDQSQNRIARETAAVFKILQRVTDGIDKMAWSSVLTLENSQHPLPDRRAEIAQWASRSVVNVRISDDVATRAKILAAEGLGNLDAAHIACAEVAGCDVFLSCDDRLIRSARRLSDSTLEIQNPTLYLEERDDAGNIDG